MNIKVHLLHEVTPSRLREEAVLSNTEKPTQSVRGTEETKELCFEQNKVKTLRKH